MRYLMLIVWVFFPLNAQESLSNSVTNCSSINGDLERLECFDNLAKSFKLTNPQNFAPIKASKWTINQSINPLNDEKKVTAILAAVSGKSRWRESIYMIVRCDSKKLEMYINWKDYLGSSANVTSRIGSLKAETMSWNLSTDSQATFFRGDVKKLLATMVDYDSYIAQITPYNESPVTAIFETQGLKEVIDSFKDECYVDLS